MPALLFFDRTRPPQRSQIECDRQFNCVGVPLSCRFFIRGEPPNKNAACGYPGSKFITNIFILLQDVSLMRSIHNIFIVIIIETTTD